MTLRAEMVRLRKVLQQLNPGAVPESRPYRLPMDLVPDSGQVLNCLQRGAHRIALEIYRGAVLPRSEAPGIAELRNRVSSLLREAVLTDGSAESLLRYAELPEARDDVEIRTAALKLLPPRSPKRAARRRRFGTAGGGTQRLTRRFTRASDPGHSGCNLTATSLLLG